MTRPLALFAFLLIAAVFVQSDLAPAARAETRVIESTVENDYPGNLIFHLTASADVNITEVSLTITYGRANSSALRQPEPFTPATDLTTSVTVDVTSGNIEIPVATDVTYSWAITTDDGDVLTTTPEQFTYLPPDREWQELESGVLRIYYYGNRERAARDLLIAGQEAFDKMATEILQTELSVVPVRVVMFVSEDEMNAAREGRSTTLDDFTQTCGLKVSTEVVYVIQTCASIDTSEILRHELTHIIVEAAGEGPLSVMPAWLNEGTAVYAQTTPGQGFEGAFNAAARTGRFLPFADIALPANNPANTNLFYGQSWAMVRFLIERNGPDDFARLFALMKDGTRYDRALEEVYGFNLAGFEEEFTAAVTQQQSPTVAPTATPGQAQPTSVAPTRAPIATSNTEDDDDGLNVAAILIVGVAVLFALLAVFAYLLSTMLASSRRSARAAAGAQPAAPEGTPPAADDWERPAPPPSPDGESLLHSSGEPSESDQPRD